MFPGGSLFDLVLLMALVGSGVRSLRRGITAELVLNRWFIPCAVTLYAFSKLRPVLLPYVSNEYLAGAIVIGSVFLGTLVIMGTVGGMAAELRWKREYMDGLLGF